MVASGSKNLLEQRMKVCTLLWDAGIKVGVFCRYTDTGYLMLKVPSNGLRALAQYP